MKLSTTARSAEATAFGLQLNGGYIEFRSGTIPANPETAASGSILISFNLTDPAGTVTAGVWTMSAQTVQLITAGGVVSWARIYESDDTVVLDASVGTSASDLIVADTTLVLDEGFVPSSMSYTQNA